MPAKGSQKQNLRKAQENLAIENRPYCRFVSVTYIALKRDNMSTRHQLIFLASHTKVLIHCVSTIGHCGDLKALYTSFLRLPSRGTERGSFPNLGNSKSKRVFNRCRFKFCVFFTVSWVFLACCAPQLLVSLHLCSSGSNTQCAKSLIFKTFIISMQS